MKCRHCETPLTHTFLDLGHAPPSNAYLTEADLNRPEAYYPLRVKVCHHCWLVQTEDYASADALFTSEYAYFSSTSASWVAHAAQYAKKITKTLALDNKSLVIEIAANDGYLLRNFVGAGIPCLGIEPTASTAEAAEKLGIPILREFFHEKLAVKLAAAGKQADLIAGNNVYAHVPDINDFTRGLNALLKPGGTITLEFPHLLQLIEQTQFDTVYHEHFSYLSLYTANNIFSSAGLRIWHVETLPTHGGSLRVYGCHKDDRRQTDSSVAALLQEEADCKLQQLQTYRDFQARADRTKNDLLAFLIDQKLAGKKVGAYGAAAKGNTLLNYAGVKPDLLPFVCDAAAAKQGKFLPGSHIPILAPRALDEHQLDFLLVLPWNLSGEIREHLHKISERGTKFVTAVPKLTIV